MVSEEFEEAFEGLWSAVKANDSNQVDMCLIVLDREDESAGAPSNLFFERVLEVAEYVSAHGNCARQVFYWIEDRYSSMSDDQKRKIRDFIAANYGRIVEKTAAFRIAEWVGRFGDEWALNLIEEWIARRATFRPDNAACIGAALSEFLDGSYGTPYSELRKRGILISREYHAALKAERP
ncbi:MAG: hypothetical protein JNN30_11320 [Rhodanobacteraceae bacterium]|nr:hypothetical protein [Rhodanobacteraceae bacterium]